MSDSREPAAFTDRERAERGFCPLPWIHLSVNTDTSMRVCCNTDHGGHVRDEDGRMVHMDRIETIESAMNQRTHRELRVAMLKGERPEFCKRCYSHEDSGGVSVRQIYKKHFRDELDRALLSTDAAGVIQPRVRYVDFSLSNNCNLQCRMCNPAASISLKKEFDALGVEYHTIATENARTGWNFAGNLGRVVQGVVPSLEEMLTTGGEPFLSPAHIKILEACVDAGRSRDIVLRYHSNLTHLPERLVQLWAHFKAVEVHVSLEGVGMVNEYVRYPAKWETILGHLHRLSDIRTEFKNARWPVHFHVEVHTCLQAVSWPRLHELLEWTFEASNELGTLFPRIPYPIWVDQPYPMTLESLPPELRQLGAKRILKVLDRYQSKFEKGPNPSFEASSSASFRGAIRRLEGLPYKEEDFRAFIRRTTEVDTFRKQDVREIIPDFRPYFT